MIDVRCVKCRYIQPYRVSSDGTITPCVICGHGVGEYLADFLYPDSPRPRHRKGFMSDSRQERAALNDDAMSLEEFMASLDRPVPVWKRGKYVAHRRWNWLRDLWREPVYAWQRARRGYSERDTWSLDHHLSGVIAGGCQRLRDRSLGYPNRMTPEEWDAVLARIIEGFQIAKAEHYSYEDERVQTAIALFAKHYFSLWD